MLFVKCMIEGRLPLPILTTHHHRHGPLSSKLRQPEQADPVIRPETIIVCNLAKGQWKHPLLLEVALVYPSERLRDDSHSIKEPRLEGSVLARGTFAVVVVRHNDPPLSPSLVVLGCLGDTGILVREDITDAVDLLVFRVDRADQCVVRDVLQVSAVAEPWACRRDVISCALALHLDQDWEIDKVSTIPGTERRQPLDALGVWRDHDLYVVTIRRWRGEDVVCLGVTVFGQLGRRWRFKFEVPDRICSRIKVEPARKDFDDDSLGRCQEDTGGRIAIQPACEVSVEGSDNRIWCSLGTSH